MRARSSRPPHVHHVGLFSPTSRWMERQVPGGLLRAVHAAWRAGYVADAELRDALPYLWSFDGFREAEREALQMFDAAGYATDDPTVQLPAVIDVYQGRASGERLGIAWSIDPERARLAAGDHGQRSGPRSTPALYSGRIAACNVLLFTSLGREVVTRRESVLDLHEGPTGAGMIPWAPAWADLGALRPGVALMLRLAGRSADLDRWMAALIPYPPPG
jgi:hypothetical protein